MSSYGEGEGMIEEYFKARMAFINENQEKLLEAWIAETGLLPSQSVLMIQTDKDGITKCWVERKND
jgi:hypothetical protein